MLSLILWLMNDEYGRLWKRLWINLRYRAFLSSPLCALLRSCDVPVDVGLLCDKPAVFREPIKGRPVQGYTKWLSGF
jgi:hypothetical protein